MKNLIVGIILGIFVFIFAWQNFDITDIDFFYWTFTIPRALLVILVFAVGLLTGWIFTSYKHHKKLDKVQKEIRK
jgi:uncharacterized integral membrane protein